MKPAIALAVTVLFFAPLHSACLSACPIGKAVNVRVIKFKDGNLKLGTLQVTKKDQNPVVAFYAGGRQVFCRADYDTSPIDARAIAATADKEHLYVAFSADGGAQHSETFTRFTDKGLQQSYGKGGGAKVLVLLKLRKGDGEPVAGTYLGARKNDSTTNSLILKKIHFGNNSLHIEADAWYSPLKHDGTPYVCSGKSPFPYTAQLAPDLTATMSTNAANCE